MQRAAPEPSLGLGGALARTHQQYQAVAYLRLSRCLRAHVKTLGHWRPVQCQSVCD